MKVGLFGNQTEKTKEVMNTFDRLCQEGCFVRDDVNPDVVITVGGERNAFRRLSPLPQSTR